MPESAPSDLSTPSFKIFAAAFALTALCILGVYVPIPFLSEGLASFIQQVCLLVGVNAGLVTVATYLVILVGNVKRGR
jgi:hypothetical protein